MRADPLESTDVATANPQIVARLKASYDQWFDDVSSTRPDNYEPPRIHLGSSHADPTVLTRQDWRRETGGTRGGGGGGRGGSWRVHVEHAGAFDVTCRFNRTAGPAELTLVVGKSRWTTRLDTGVTCCRLDNLEFEAGDVEIRAMVVEEQMSRPVDQIDVSGTITPGLPMKEQEAPVS